MISGDTSVQVRRMRPADVNAVVDWHMQSFPHGFYSRLGHDFMVRYVREHLRSPAAVAFSAVDPHTEMVIGYLLGSLDDDQHRAHKARHATVPLARAGAAALRRRPHMWGEFLRVRSLQYLRRLARDGLARRRPDAGTVEEAPRSAELLFVCVAPVHRLRGAGAALHDAFAHEAAESAATQLHLVTEIGNTVAIGFYQRRGWIAAVEVTGRDGRRLVRMVNHLKGVGS